MKSYVLSFFILFCSFSYAQNLKVPKISVNALMLYRNSNFHQEDKNPAALDMAPNGLNIREAEIQFRDDVDPYTRMNLILAVSPEYQTDGTEVTEEWAVEPEEFFVETHVLPSTTLKAGKFFASFGRHNLLHTHAYPFVEAPFVNQLLMGDEGFNDIGVSAAYLLPTSWFSELTFQYFRGEGENEQFKSPTPSDGVALLHGTQVFDTSEFSTLRVGVSFAHGDNSFGEPTDLRGVDVTWKWRPNEGARDRSFMVSSEYLSRTREQKSLSSETGEGYAHFIQYQYHQRWSVLYRFDTLHVENSFSTVDLPNRVWERHALGFVFRPSEFSSVTFEYNQRDRGPLSLDGDKIEKSFFLQAQFVIGSHPVHSY